MIEPLDTAQEQERALLVACTQRGQGQERTAEMVDELAELAGTYGAEVVDRMIVRLGDPNPRYLIGSGNVEKIIQAVHSQQCNLLIFDEELTPAQQRNWEKKAKIPVIDRHGLILEIFAQRASTREAVLQIELARAEYMLPRLKGGWTHLSRQRGGGAGARGGEGEKQLELDSRMVREQIAKLKAELKTVQKRRAEQRKKRQSVPVPTASIVGYTNAGKSSLLNRMTHAKVLVEDKLFATLDPTTRRVELPNNQIMLLTDTVGFVRKLPHDLVEAFKATLEEAVQANFLVHVVDASNPAAEEHITTTFQVLEEIGVRDKEHILVFNKIDLLDEPYQIARIRRRHPEAVFVSVHAGTGLDDLSDRMAEIIADNLDEQQYCLPHDRFDLVALLHRTSNVEEERYEEDGIHISASVPPATRRQLADYLVPQPEPTDNLSIPLV